MNDTLVSTTTQRDGSYKKLCYNDDGDDDDDDNNDDNKNVAVYQFLLSLRSDARNHMYLFP